MSAGMPVVDRDLDKLAPAFRSAVIAALADCHRDGLDAFVYEAMRSPELQALYYARGRTIRPPNRPVTNAQSNLQSWHGFGLSVDIISAAHQWDRPWTWFVSMAAHFTRRGCRWGGEWRNPDAPHIQHGTCKPSPSNHARELLATEGIEAVWRAVGADKERRSGPVRVISEVPAVLGGVALSP